MLVVKTRLEDRNGKTVVLADQKITMHDSVWIYAKAEQMRYLEVGGESSNMYEKFGYWDTFLVCYMLCKDNAKYLRCADSKENANLMIAASGTMIASKAIDIGEELLEWYPDYMTKYDLKRYNIDTGKKEEEVCQV